MIDWLAGLIEEYAEDGRMIQIVINTNDGTEIETELIPESCVIKGDLLYIYSTNDKRFVLNCENVDYDEVDDIVTCSSNMSNIYIEL